MIESTELILKDFYPALREQIPKAAYNSQLKIYNILLVLLIRNGSFHMFGGGNEVTGGAWRGVRRGGGKVHLFKCSLTLKKLLLRIYTAFQQSSLHS